MMDQTGNTSQGAEARTWFGRILIAVILGEAIWNLIVSVMNNLVVPWLGDVTGQTSGLPTSFTQRPYNYPDLFVSLFEFCMAGLVAAILNYFSERLRVGTVKSGKSRVPTVPSRPAPVPPQASLAVPQAATTPAAMSPAALPLAPRPPAMPPVAPPPPVTVPAAPAPSLSVAPAPVPKPLPVPGVPTVANSVAKPLPAAPKAEPPRPKKPKQVYYNIVGEPMPSDED